MNGLDALILIIVIFLIGSIPLFLINCAIELYLIKQKLSEEQISWLLSMQKSQIRFTARDSSPVRSLLSLSLIYSKLKILQLELRYRELRKSSSVLVIGETSKSFIME